MNPVVVILAGDINDPVRGLIKGSDGLALRISLMRPAAQCLLGQYPILEGKSLSIRLVSKHWHESPWLKGTIRETTTLRDELTMKFELYDWRALADFWGRELHWLQHSSESQT